MTIEETSLATIFKCENGSVEKIFIDFSEKYINFKSNNVILDLSDIKGLTTENILLFSKHSEEIKDNGTSFVIVVDSIDVDEIGDEMLVVPTLTEAKDIIEMENIERDLGF